MAQRPKVTRPEVVVTAAPGRKRTFIVQPKVGADAHRPMARFTVTPTWVDIAANETHALWQGDAHEDGSVGSVQYILEPALNSPNGEGRRLFVWRGCRVELRFGPPDGRLRFVSYDQKNQLLAYGLADAAVIHDLLDCISPMEPQSWHTHNNTSRLADGEVSVPDPDDEV